MKITAITSSPHKNANSSAMVSRMVEALGAEIVDTYDLNSVCVKPCTGCGTCAGKLACSIGDDMGNIYESMKDSEVIIMGSPLFWWNISAQLKALIDRLYVFIGKGVLDGKRLVLLVSGYSEIPNSGYEIIDAMFKEITAYLNMEYSVLFVSADASRHVLNNRSALADIDAMAAQIKKLCN